LDASVSTRPGSSVVRITSRCAAIGFSTRTGERSGGGVDPSSASVPDDTKLNVTISCQSRATSRRRRSPALRCASASGSMCWTCAAGVGGMLSYAVHPRDFLDEVFLDRQVEAVGRRRHDEVGAGAFERKAEPLEGISDHVVAKRQPRMRVTRSGRTFTGSRRGKAPATSVSGPARPPQTATISSVARSTARAQPPKSTPRSKR
jgi:hypothetical protein